MRSAVQTGIRKWVFGSRIKKIRFIFPIPNTQYPIPSYIPGEAC